STLAAGESCPISVTFAPYLFGTQSTTLQVGLATGEPLLAKLSGYGLGPENFNLEPSSIDFLWVAPNTDTSLPRPVTVIATGPAPLTVASVSTTDSVQFQIRRNGCQGTFAIGERCQIMVVFAPVGPEGWRTATLTVRSSDGI